MCCCRQVRPPTFARVDASRTIFAEFGNCIGVCTYCLHAALNPNPRRGGCVAVGVRAGLSQDAASAAAAAAAACAAAGYAGAAAPPPRPARRYPVLIMHDGQNVLDDASSFTGVSWGLAEAASELWASGQAQEFVAACVWNTPGRQQEYMPAGVRPAANIKLWHLDCNSRPTAQVTGTAISAGTAAVPLSLSSLSVFVKAINVSFSFTVIVVVIFLFEFARPCHMCCAQPR